MKTYAIVEMEDDGTYTIMKQSISLMDLQHSSLDGEHFPSVYISRDDIFGVLADRAVWSDADKETIEKELDSAWEKIKVIPDQDMEQIATKLQDNLVAYGGYWGFISDWLDDRDITIPMK
jgi:hypothetical protein